MQWNSIIDNLVNSAVFAGLGLVIFALSFWILERLTSFSFKKELIEEHNTALAIVVGSMSIGLCLIIAFAIH